MPPTTNVGVLGSGAVAGVDPCGAVSASDNVTLDWWIGADDRWHIPAEETTTRHNRAWAAPVIETLVRVPGGDAVQRVYGATVDARAVAVVEIENRSPAPFTAALVVRVPRGLVEVSDATVRIDGVVVLALPRPPGASAAAASSRELVTGGAARAGAVEPVRGPIELTLLFPVAHRTTLRAALTPIPLDVRSIPDAETVARGWERQLERGMQAGLPAPFDALVDVMRADLLLVPRQDPAVVAALEDWGFDAEAADGWARLGLRARRRARRRTVPADPWKAVAKIDAAGNAAAFLSNLRAVLVRERGSVIDLLPGFPPDWLGQSVTVDAVPLHRGPLSFAVRWHGARPALLWEAPDGVELRAPGLDPAWHSSAPSGEALLAEPPTPLLSMGAPDRSAGARVDAPKEFT